jgi:hypothetical protein
MKIPLTEIQGMEDKGIIFRYVDLKINGMDTEIRIFNSLANKISEESHYRWRYKKLVITN